VNAVGGHAFHRRNDDFAHDPRVNFRRHDGRGRIRAHTAGVRSVIAFSETLVVLRRCKRQHIASVDHDDEACFLAGKVIFDDDACTRIAERVSDQHVVNRNVCLIA